MTTGAGYLIEVLDDARDGTGKWYLVPGQVARSYDECALDIRYLQSMHFWDTMRIVEAYALPGPDPWASATFHGARLALMARTLEDRPDGETVMPYSVLGGTLIREARNVWRWRDGVPEPRASDLSPDEWNFRCRTTGGETMVEVMRGVAMETTGLAWVLEGYRAGRYAAGQSGDHTGPLVFDGEGVRRRHLRPGADPLAGDPRDALPEAPGPIPAVILVPVADWDAWVRDHPVGALWLTADEPAILERAKELGWMAPDHG